MAIELNINPRIVRIIINRAKEFQAKEEASYEEKIPDSEYEYDWMQILADHQDDLTFVEVKGIIDDLDPKEQIDLLAMMYYGRGDFEPEQWSAAHKEAANNLAPNLAEYLLTKPHIADYLENALDLLGYTVSS